MICFAQYINELNMLTSSNDNFIEKQRKYINLIRKISKLPLTNINPDEYRYFCQLNKYFVKRKDINYPASRLVLVQCSLDYILDMMRIIYERFISEREEIEEVSKLYGFAVDFFNSTLKLNYDSEKTELVSLFNKFIIMFDIVDDEDIFDSDILDIAYLIIETISKPMFHFADGDLAIELFKIWGYLQDIIFPFDQDYRDHLIHQFYVFLLGTTMLSKLQVRIIENWIHFDIRDTEEVKRRTFRTWFLSSLFHDIGYIAGKLKEISEYVCKHFFSNLPGVECQKFNLKLDFKDKKFSTYLMFMEKISDGNEFIYYRGRSKELNNSKIRKIKKKLDHGLLSSYLLWNAKVSQVDGLPIRPIETIKAQISLRFANNKENNNGIVKRLHKALLRDNVSHKSIKDEIIEDIEIASYAIAAHTLNNRKVNFIYHPITFLLILCDELQFWGRVSISQKRLIIMPSNEIISCLILFENELYSTLPNILKGFGNLEKYLTFICQKMATNCDEGKFIELFSTDVIIIKYANIIETDLVDIISKFRNLFLNRLTNGPSLIVTNRKINNDNILFIAMRLKNNSNYSFYNLD
jgi:hypothetical protein